MVDGKLWQMFNQMAMVRMLFLDIGSATCLIFEGGVSLRRPAAGSV